MSDVPGSDSADQLTLGGSGDPNPEVEVRRNRWWLVSGVVTLALSILLVQLWVAKNRTHVEQFQLNDQDAVNLFLSNRWESRGEADAQVMPTGVFVQSLRFESASDVHMTGYVWQHFPEVQPDDVPVGFILPELVDSSVPMRLEYRVAEGDGEVIGWYFEGVVRQPFEYSQYPFDHKVVWLRIWPRDFSANTVLVPDLEAYPCSDPPCTDPGDTFGVEETIVLGDWDREDTFFDYFVSDYNTNFGINQYAGQTNFPELRYNMLITRRFENAFIVNLVPLFVVAMLAFAALMTTTRDPKRSSIFGFSTAGTIGTVSALFFVVLLAHIQLREQFAGSGVVYIEWFYFMMYLVLLGVAVNTYLVSASWSTHLRAVAYGDNLIAKVTYWPVLIGAMVAITVVGL